MKIDAKSVTLEMLRTRLATVSRKIVDGTGDNSAPLSVVVDGIRVSLDTDHFQVDDEGTLLISTTPNYINEMLENNRTVILHAADLLETEASALKEASTVNGEWDEEQDAEDAYNELVETVRQLRFIGGR